MGWSADSAQITADQTCWKADGYEFCDADASRSAGPMGPGFFIFFQQQSIEEKLLTSGGREFIGKDRRLIEDEEILMVIQLAVSYKLI